MSDTNTTMLAAQNAAAENDATDNANEIDTVEHAEMLLAQDEAIAKRVNEGASLDEAIDPSNKEFGPLAHPEQVQMRVAKRANVFACVESTQCFQP